MSSSDDKEKFVEDYSYTTEAINQILVIANCPNKFRQYIDCIVGVANGNIEFEASDKQVAERARGKIHGTKKHANREWAKDKRTELLKWQDKGNLKLFDFEVRDYDPKTNTRPLSKYTLYLVNYAKQVVTEAQKDKSSWDSNSSLAIKQAATKIVADLMGKQVNTPTNKKYIDPQTEVKTKLRSAGTNLREALRMLNKYDFSLMRDDENLLEELEDSIRAIRERGFIDDIMDTIIFTGIEREDKP